MRVTFLTNIPSPYRLDFFNELGKYIDVKVIFEAERNYSLNEKWYTDKKENFEAIFLKKGEIEEKRINWKIIKHINKKNQDLVIVTNYAYYTELIGLLYLKLRRIPYCMEIDGGIIRDENIILRYFKRFLMRGAKGYISPSKQTDNFFKYYGVNEDKIYRYNFTSLKENDILENPLKKDEKILLKSKLGIKEERVLLSVGRFIYSKGYDILLNACRDINSDIGIYIVGGEPTKEYIKMKNDFKLDNLHFVEFKTKQELKEYYKVADLFVLPTREDVWGLVINEAMAQGNPVITTDKCVAGVELIKDNENGFIVQVESISELSSSINKILENSMLRERISKNNISKIKGYTIENMAKTHLSIFNKVKNINN